MRGQLIESGVHRMLCRHYNANGRARLTDGNLSDVKVRNRKKHTDEEQNRDRNDSQPQHHELTLVLIRRRRRDSKHQREPSKNICERLDHVSVSTHSMTASSTGCILFEIQYRSRGTTPSPFLRKDFILKE